MGRMYPNIDEHKNNAADFYVEDENQYLKLDQAYTNGQEHIIALMHRIELMFQREILRRRGQLHDAGLDDSNAWMKFAAITNEEIDALLRLGPDPRYHSDSNESENDIESAFALLSKELETRKNASLLSGYNLPFVSLAVSFGLTEVECDILAVCLAPELDRRYERLCGYLHDDMTRRRPSIGLLIDMCFSTLRERIDALSLFNPHSVLMRYQIIKLVDEPATGVPFPSRLVRLDDRIVSYLMGENTFDIRIQHLLNFVLPAKINKVLDNERQSQVTRLVRLISSLSPDESSVVKPVLYLYGGVDTHKQSLIEDVCQKLDAPVITIDGARLNISQVGFGQGLALAIREAILAQSILCINDVDNGLLNDSAQTNLLTLVQILNSYPGKVIMTGERPLSWPITNQRSLLPLELPPVSYTQNITVWRNALKTRCELDDLDLMRLASVHPLSQQEINAVVEVASALAKLQDRQITLADIEQSCQTQNHIDLGHLARKVNAKHRWEDLILPEPIMQQLREICLQAKYRCQVYGHWGFDRKLSLGKGLNVLFAGPSGTGKTMSAEVIANALALNLYKIDLSQVVSKYIGETEKNLHNIFRVAQSANAILFFDEADALLGKRSDVKDAHDRYANIEVAYLLQKMEEYEGITILATNLRKNIDDAFARRIRFIVEFPFPEEEDRLRIWRGIWPTETPISSAVDFNRLAQQYKLSGGNIRNVALAAAFLAAEEGCSVDMRHLLQATKREQQKMGRLVNDEEYARYG